MTRKRWIVILLTVTLTAGTAIPVSAALAGDGNAHRGSGPLHKRWVAHMIRQKEKELHRVEVKAAEALQEREATLARRRARLQRIEARLSRIAERKQAAAEHKEASAEEDPETAANKHGGEGSAKPGAQVEQRAALLHGNSHTTSQAISNLEQALARIKTKLEERERRIQAKIETLKAKLAH